MKNREYSYGRQTISLGDIWEVVRALRSPWLTQGPRIRDFENAICSYTGAKYTVAVSSATAGLHLAMMALGIGPGDKVITSPITFLASANCARYVGADVGFVDIDERTACMDADKFESCIDLSTRAVIPVHYAGHSCDMERIAKIARSRGLAIVEDAAHALGTKYRGARIGSCSHADMAVFSFHPVKTITTGEGGAITTNDKNLYEKLIMLRTHGITRDSGKLKQKDEGPWYYEMQELGYNYRITDIQAALGLSQLKRLDSFIRRRREIVEMYKEGFAEIPGCYTLSEEEYSNSTYHLFPIQIDFLHMNILKKNLFTIFSQNGLNLQVHYIPVHLQPYYQKMGFYAGMFPKAEEYYRRTISLPLYPALKNKNVKEIIYRVKIIMKKHYSV